MILEPTKRGTRKNRKEKDFLLRYTEIGCQYIFGFTEDTILIVKYVQ